MGVESLGSQEGKRDLKEWLFGDLTPKTKAAAEMVLNRNSDLTEAMFDAANEEETAQIKALIGEYIDASPKVGEVHTAQNKAAMKRIEAEIARIIEAAFDREN